MLSSELRDKIVQFIESVITVEQLEDWLVPRLPVFLKSPNTADADIIAAIELGLAEMCDRIITEDEFRSLLRDALQEHTILFTFSPSGTYESNYSASTNQTMTATSPQSFEITYPTSGIAITVVQSLSQDVRT